MLNPKLYKSLIDRFTKVQVSNEGERMLMKDVPDARRPGRTRQIALSSGEYYRVDCPYCGDRRGRLWINHRWNTKTADGKTWGSWLAICYNEGCDLSRLKDELEIYLMDKPLIRRPHKEEYKEEDLFKTVDLPGTCVPVTRLKAGHAARAYLAERNFDPAELVEQWSVHFCVDAPEDREGFIPGTKWHARAVRNRLIIPIYRLGTMVGWQARAINEISQPKYYTMPGLKKQHLIYNGDVCRMYKFGVIVEGVTDAWRVGPRAGALLGKEISVFQKQLIMTYWGSGAMCLLLDPDAMEDMEKLDRMIRLDAFRWGGFALKLPAKDPACMDRQELWRLISDYARSRGIQLLSV
jgi:hypothetical protein